jgi:hypothetical protein
MDDGQVIGPITMPEIAREDVDIELVQEIGPRSFDRCPICGDPATEDEHVPPQSIGGEVMTRTCGPCNHRFGSYVEPDLLDWLDGVMLSTRLRSDQLGQRPGSSRRIGLRRTPQGFVLVPGDGRDLQEVLDAGGDVDLRWRSVDFRRCWLALLKQAYLAFCLRYGIPDDPGANEIRTELIAVRDARSHADLPASPLSERLLVAAQRTAMAGLPPLVEARAMYQSGPIPGVLLVGRVFVGWAIGPLRQAPMAGPSEYSIPLRIGAPIEGITEAVSSASQS